MKVLHSLQGLEASSGISTFVVEVCNRQAQMGHEIVFVYERTLERAFDSRVRVVQERELATLDFHPDVVHQHAVWSPFSARILRWARQRGIPFVVSPHGCLMPRVLRKGWLKKRIFLTFLLRPLLKRAKAIHCTSAAERAAVENLRFGVPTAVVPLGCNLPALDVVRPVCRAFTVLFLGRISEEKGLLLLLDAWRQLKGESNNRTIEQFSLILAGPDWNGYRAVLERKIAAESIPDVTFSGPADAARKDELYRRADLFVLPSPMENFSAVVLDALAYGVPVVCTKGTPWGGIERDRCGWWIEPNSVTALQTALMEAMGLCPQERLKMGARGRTLAERDYAWVEVVKSVLALYVLK